MNYVFSRKGNQEASTGLWRGRDAVDWRTAVPHGQSAIGPSSLFYSSNGEGVSFPHAASLTLSVREHYEQRWLVRKSCSWGGFAALAAWVRGAWLR